MKAAPMIVSTLALTTIWCAGCPAPSPGGDPGTGVCGDEIRDAGFPAQTGVALCGGDAGSRSITLPSSGCVCERNQDIPDLLDVKAQHDKMSQEGRSRSGCNYDRDFVFADPTCAQLGYASGFSTGRYTHDFGNNHDWDTHPTICPFSEGVQQFINPGDIHEHEPLELRGFPAAGAGQILFGEVKWCRWYQGPMGPFDEFRPKVGERLTMVGDWIIDNVDHTEIHPARVIANAKAAPGCADPTASSCTSPDTWHIMTNGFFQIDSLQDVDRQLLVRVPLPPPTDPSLTTLHCGLADQRCGRAGIAHYTPERLNPNRPDEGPTVVDISIDPVSATPVQHYCPGGVWRDNLCPCDTPDGCLDAGVAETTPDGGERLVPAPRLDHCFIGSTPIPFAGDIECTWKPDPTLWMCDCSCGDPSMPGATFTVPVQGCVTGNLEPEDPEGAVAGCAQVCGGTVCGEGAPACDIGACHPVAQGVPYAEEVGVSDCQGYTPAVRVTSAAQYRIELTTTGYDAASASLGKVHGRDIEFDTVVPLTGTLWVNLAGQGMDRRLEVVRVDVSAPPSDVRSHTLTGAGGFAVNRFTAFWTPNGGLYRVPTGHARVGADINIDEAPFESTFVNQYPLGVRISVAKKTFSMAATGQDDKGNALWLSLNGHIVNSPPEANAGGDRFVECTSPATTQVTLDASKSTDPDQQPIAHYQWFEGATPLGNTATVTTEATMGAHVYTTHVYDPELASGVDSATVTVRDTVPPTIVAVNPACFWPPNHRFVKLDLFSDLHAAAADTCDPHPTIRIASVTSDQAVNAPGSGNTSPDVVFGPHTACVRAERAGGQGARHYTVRIEATDASGNVGYKDLHVVVPHDKAGQPACQRATGLDTPDASCSL